MIQPLRAGLLAALPLLAAATVAAQTLPADGTPQLRHLSSTSAAALRQLPLDSRQLLRQELALRPADDLRALRVETDELGQRHERFQQYFEGIKVEHGVYTVHRAAGVLSGEFKPVPATLSPKPALTAAAALQRGLAAVGARRYMWEDPAEEAGLQRQTQNPAATYRPGGELVIVEDFRVADPARRPLVLAWKFNIYAQEPQSRALVYVDARTGAVVLQDAIIKHANGLVPAGTAKAPAARPTSGRGVATTATGTFATRYVGSRQVATDLQNGTHRLRDYTRGLGIETYNLRTGTVLGNGVDFTDLDNDWTAAEFNNAAKDNAALDAHFGSTKVYDYWLTVHGRNSWDGLGSKLINYVHYRANYDNASWNGSAMQYGDGATLFRPLTALDVCAHETGHGVCQATASLVYLNESGALNEGFSDIWGATIEYYVDPTKQTWIVGEDISITSGGLRSMSDPLSTSVLTSCPANYKGRRWNFGATDNGGVHTNSGVLNHWYYILSVGKTGVNEQQQAYSVTGIGIASAARIAYRAERLYLTPNSDYRSARVFTIQAATELFGATSPEVTAVTDAWYAVGLGTSSTAPAGAQAQCPTDDAPVLTATTSAASVPVCAGTSFTLRATATYPTTRRLRNTAALALPDGALTYSAVPVYSTALTSGATYQHGLENIYRYLTDLRGVRVRLNHAQPDQVALRLAISTTAGGVTYLNLASALPTAPNGSAPVALDLTFADNAAGGLPATVSGTTLTGTYQPATALASLQLTGTLTSITLEAKDGQLGSAGSVELVELLFNRLATDVPSVRWTGPGVETVGLLATTTAMAPATGGTATYRYTVLASDPYFGCTSAQDVSVTVIKPVLAAAAVQPDLCAGRNQAFGPASLRVTADDSLPGQVYFWSGPNGFGATGKRVSVTPATGGLFRYSVSTASPTSNCTSQQLVSVVARRQVVARPTDIDSVACARGTVRLRSRMLENQLAGPYQFTGSVQIPDNNPVGVRIPLAVAGTPEGFFDLRGIRVSITHTYTGDLTLYVEAPDGTRVLLSRQNGGAGRNYQNTLFTDSVGAQRLNTGVAPFIGTWKVDEPTGFAKLRNAPQAGTWNLFVVDSGPADVGPVTAWSLVTRDNAVTWSGPNGISATGSDVLAPTPAAAGRYRYIGVTSAGGCQFRDTVDVRVAPGPEWRLRLTPDLSLAANWTCLPTPTTDADVRGTLSGQPVLTTGLVQVRNLTLRAGTALALNGGTLEVYGNLIVEFGATIAGTNGTLAFRGAGGIINAYSSSLRQVPNLVVNLASATDTVRLTTDATILQTLDMQRGILKTVTPGGSTVTELTMGPTATITETADAYVSGRIWSGGLLPANGRLDFGGLGLRLTQSAGNAVGVGILRVTDQAIGRAPARTSIRRYYSLNYSSSLTVGATVRLGYRDAELNNLLETDLQPFRATTLAGPWQPLVRTAQSTSLNYVEATATNIAGVWTLSTNSAMLPTRLAAATSFGVQAQPVPFGAAGFALSLQATKPPRAAMVAVYDLTGRLLLQRTLAVPAGLSAVALPEAGRLAAGVYVVRVVLDGEAQTLRVTHE